MSKFKDILLKLELGMLEILDLIDESALEEVTDIEFLCLANVLNKNTSLTKFSLSFIYMKDEAINALFKALGNNSTITTLNLQATLLDGEKAENFASALKQNKSVKSLQLSACAIGAGDSISILIEALKVNKTITILNLSNNAIDNEGARAFIEAIKVNKTVKSIDLSDNNADNDVIKELNDALKARQEIGSSSDTATDKAKTPHVKKRKSASKDEEEEQQTEDEDEEQQTKDEDLSQTYIFCKFQKNEYPEVCKLTEGEDGYYYADTSNLEEYGEPELLGSDGDE